VALAGPLEAGCSAVAAQAFLAAVVLNRQPGMQVPAQASSGA
jgi:hypothetical protein